MVSNKRVEPGDTLHLGLDSISFVDLLEVNIRRDNLPACLLGHNRQEKTKSLFGNSTLRQFIHHFNLVLIKLLSDFNHFNLKWPIDTNKPKFRMKCSRFLAYLIGERTLRQKCFTLILMIQTMAAVLIATILYYQYVYDFDKIRLKRLVAKQQSSPDGHQFVGERTELERRVRESRETLRAIGAPNMEWGIVVEYAYAYFLQGGVFTMLVVPFYLNFHRCAYFPWARYFLNAAGERRTQAGSIARLIDEFVKSSRSYTRLRLELMVQSFSLQKQAKILARLPGDSAKLLNEHRWCGYSMSRLGDEPDDEHLKKMSHAINTLESRLLYQRHNSRCRQAQRLALMGYLNPLVDRSGDWLDKLALLNVSTFCTSVLYSALCMLYLYLELDKYFISIGRPARFETFRDIRTFILGFIGVEMLFQSIAFLFSLCYISFIDLLRTLYFLRKMIFRAIRRIDTATQQLNDILASITADEQTIITMGIRFAGARCRQEHMPPQGGWHRITAELSLPPGRDRPPNKADWSGTARGPASYGNMRRALDLIETIETDTTAALLHFKYFCAEFERLRACYEVYAFIMFYVPGSFQVLIRLNMPYVDDDKTRLFMVVASLAAAPSFFLSWPYCYIHKRCLGIYKALLSLWAQLAVLQSKKITRDCLNIDHQTSLLLKQLERPDLFSRRFAIRLMDLVGLTYSNVMRIQFWISLVTISMLVDISPFLNNLTDQLLSDPFGVFK
jgi:hypothetical protein